MSKKLLVQAIIKFFSGLLIIGLLVFLPAGSFSYKQGWLFMATLFIPIFIMGIVLMIKDPKLLEKRLNAKETESEQKQVISYSAIMFLISFILAGLNYRFNWFVLPIWLSYLFMVVFILGYVLFALVIKQNEYLSRTIEVQENQRVVDTGLYGVVRHPMYMATLILFFSMPLILGSLISFVIMLVYIPIIQKRMNNEEEVLEKQLKGYKEYKDKVKYRIIPYIW